MRTAVQITTALLLTTAAAAAAAATHGLHAATMTNDTRADIIEGTWTLAQIDESRMQMNLEMATGVSGRSVYRAELVGLTDAQIGAARAAPVAFRIEREAGVFEMEGTFGEGRGAGRFRFRPDRAFVSSLRSIGVQDADRLTDRELMTLALAGASSATLRELVGMGVSPLDARGAIRLSVHAVSPEYVREVRALGLAGTSAPEDLVRLRIHGVSAEFVREMESAGYRGLSRDELLEMRIHQVDAGRVRELRAAGFENLTPRQLVRMTTHRVTPEYVRAMREAGVRDLSPEALVEMSVHGMTPEYVRELAAAGYPDLSRQQLKRFATHGVTPAFIREVHAAGYRDVSPDALVRMKTRGIGAERARTERRRTRA